MAAVPSTVVDAATDVLDSGTEVDDAVVTGVTLRGTWLDKVIAELSYANYSGGGFDHWIIDRDNVAFNIKYSF